MNKKNNKFKIVLILLITNIITFLVSNFVGLGLGKKVLVNNRDYLELEKYREQYSKINLIEKIIDSQYYKKPDKSKYLDWQLKGLVASLEDPYSQYLSEDEYQALTEETSGSFGGIGVIVSPGEDNLITVVSPIEGTPGERAGIRPGDKIIKVEGEEFTADDMDKAIKKMKGKPGSKVKITIMRELKEKRDVKELDIKREEIRVDSVESDVIDNLGYIRLKSFDELTYKEFMEEFKKLEDKKIEGLIIDLRNNPGGLLDVCADITDELIGEGDIVYTEDRSGKREYIKSDKQSIDLPLVVLVNEGSASASEILSGAIRDHNRGKLIGTTTFGKGLVQSIQKLPDGSGLKLTTSEYFTPKGTNIHEIGIEPDYVVELPEEIEGIGIDYIESDKQLQKAIEVLKKDI